jgi:hypothetical protein
VAFHRCRKLIPDRVDLQLARSVTFRPYPRGCLYGLCLGRFVTRYLKHRVLPGSQWVAGSRSRPPQWKKIAILKCSRLRKP